MSSTEALKKMLKGPGLSAFHRMTVSLLGNDNDTGQLFTVHPEISKLSGLMTVVIVLINPDCLNGCFYYTSNRGNQNH